MAYVKTTWTDNALPAITAAQLNRIEQGVADAHATGVPTIIDFAGGTSIDFTGLADDTVYELVVRGKLDAPNTANQPQLYVQPNGASTIGARNVNWRTYRTNTDTQTADWIGSYGNDYGIFLVSMDYSAAGWFISRTTFFRDGTDKKLVHINDAIFRPSANFAALRHASGGYVEVANPLTSIRVLTGGNPAILTRTKAILRTVG